MARTGSEAIGSPERIGYPVLVRPSFVLGGRAMEVVYDRAGLASYMDGTARSPVETAAAGRQVPRLGDRVDVDAIADGDDVVIGGIMEHIEEAGIPRRLELLAAAIHSRRP